MSNSKKHKINLDFYMVINIDGLVFGVFSERQYAESMAESIGGTILTCSGTCDKNELIKNGEIGIVKLQDRVESLTHRIHVANKSNSWTSDRLTRVSNRLRKDIDDLRELVDKVSKIDTNGNDLITFHTHVD